MWRNMFSRFSPRTRCNSGKLSRKCRDAGGRLSPKGCVPEWCWQENEIDGCVLAFRLCGAGRRMRLMVACWRLDAGRRLSPRVGTLAGD